MWVTGILFCVPVGERGNLAKSFYYWDNDNVERLPSNDVIEIHVWERHLGYTGITYSSFYTLPLEMVEGMSARITVVNISNELNELGEMYGEEW